MDRREFIRTANLTGAGIVLGGTNARKAEGRGSGTKSGHTIRNVLFLLVDQQRQDCLRCYGNPIV